MDNRIIDIMINGTVEEQRILIEELKGEISVLKKEAAEREEVRQRAIEEAAKEEMIKQKVVEGMDKLMETIEEKKIDIKKLNFRE